MRHVTAALLLLTPLGACDAGGDARDSGPRCPVPVAPTLAVVHAGAELAFWHPAPDATIEIAEDRGAFAPKTRVRFAPDLADTTHRVRARTAAEAGVDCVAGEFDHTYAVAMAYAPADGQPGTTAVALDDPAIRAWASDWVDVTYGDGVDPAWQEPARALGPALGTTTDIVALGEGGAITLSFDPPVRDGRGADLVVFENGFSATFLELAFVEVSSDGVHFERFDSAYLGVEPLGAYDQQDPEIISGLAGKYRRGWGTPFDLALLRYRPAVRAGRLDLDAVRYVRIVDVVGDGSATDSFGQAIFDPYPTVGSAGFDLDAVGALHPAR